jgi:hypothetical protein
MGVSSIADLAEPRNNREILIHQNGSFRQAYSRKKQKSRKSRNLFSAFSAFALFAADLS